MTRRVWIAIAAALFTIVPCARAQQENAFNLTLYRTSFQTQSDTLTLTNNGVQGFPNIEVGCPKDAKHGCTLGISVSSELIYLGSGELDNTVVLSLTGRGIPPIDPAASIPVDTIYDTEGWSSFGFHWMQRGVPAESSVMINVQFVGDGQASNRTETVQVFKN